MDLIEILKKPIFADNDKKSEDHKQPRYWTWPIVLSLYGAIGYLILTRLAEYFWVVCENGKQTPVGSVILSIIVLIILFWTYLDYGTYASSQDKIDIGGVDPRKVTFRGITIFVSFCALVFLYWWVRLTSFARISIQFQIALAGITPLFASLLIWLNNLYLDYWNRLNQGILSSQHTSNIPRSRITAILEYLKSIRCDYSWLIKVSLTVFLGIAVSFSWNAAKMDSGFQNSKNPLIWGMIIASYGSIGLLLIGNQFIRRIIRLIDQRMFKLEKSDDHNIID